SRPFGRLLFLEEQNPDSLLRRIGVYFVKPRRLQLALRVLPVRLERALLQPALQVLLPEELLPLLQQEVFQLPLQQVVLLPSPVLFLQAAVLVSVLALVQVSASVQLC